MRAAGVALVTGASRGLGRAVALELAERSHAGRRSVAGRVTSPAADAILDAAAPLRGACDPIGEGLLAGWRQAGDEDWMRGLLAGLGPAEPA